MTFSLQSFALSPQKLIIGTQWITNKHLTFLVNVWSIASECFLFTNFTITCLVVLVAFLPSSSLWQPSMSKGLTLIPEPLQILTTVCSRFWSEILLEIPDILTLLHLLDCSDFNCYFLRFIILFWRFWLTYLTINNSLFNFLLAVTIHIHWKLRDLV